MFFSDFILTFPVFVDFFLISFGFFLTLSDFLDLVGLHSDFLGLFRLLRILLDLFGLPRIFRTFSDFVGLFRIFADSS